MRRKTIRRRKIVAVLAVIAFVFYAFVVDGSVHTRFSSPVPTFVTADSHVGKSTAVESGDFVAYFNGVQGSGTTHSVAIRQTWARFGKVVIIEYAKFNFSAATTIRTTYDWLIAHRARRVTIIGVSMGGLLALDLVDLIRAHKSKLRDRVILEDVPAGASSLMQPGSDASRVIHPGWLLNLASSQFWSIFGSPTPPGMRGSGSNSAQINADDHVTLTWPISSFMEQIRYIVTHSLPKVGAYANIPMVYIQSTLDRTVKNDSAYWMGVFGSHLLVRVVGTHSGLVSYPDAYRGGYTTAFQLFPPWTQSEVGVKTGKRY